MSTAENIKNTGKPEDIELVEEKIRVLYIDDEVNNLRSFEAGFRRKFEVYTASTALEGMDILNEKRVHIIIADQRMPVTTGVEFLNVVRTAFPDAIRILLTGYTDMEAIVDAVNKGEIFRYITKPWNEAELYTAIRNAYDAYIIKQQLKDKIQELQKVNNELNRFIYTISHDLRSPLSSAMGVLNLARMDNSVIDPHNYMGMIETCVKKMDDFIYRIVEYHTSIRIEEKLSIIDFLTLLNECVKYSSSQHPTIDFKINVEQPGLYKGDNFRISLILNNLIANAIKYQKLQEVQHPQIKISVKVNNYNAYISIEDNGIGILEEHLNNIFKMFFQMQSNISGVGINLYIVKEALSKLGGTIEIRSKPGEGTIFELIIPNRV